MKKFIFLLSHTEEVIRLEIYSINWIEAVKNITVSTGCKEEKMQLIEETESLLPQTWIF